MSEQTEGGPASEDREVLGRAHRYIAADIFVDSFVDASPEFFDAVEAFENAQRAFTVSDLIRLAALADGS